MELTTLHIRKERDFKSIETKVLGRAKSRDSNGLF